MTRDLEYEENNIGYDYQYDKESGGGIKCKNYEVCNEVLPKWWFECKGNYLCMNCHINFGKYLDIENNIECPICLEVKRGITQLKCNHSLCIECFKRCYYGDESREGEPIFPHPEIEDECEQDTYENIITKWYDKYPLIKKYDEDWKKWEDKKEEKYNNETYLRVCPLCKK